MAITEGKMSNNDNTDGLKSPPRAGIAPLPLSLEVAYEAPSRLIRRVILQTSGTTDPGYDNLGVIESDHQGTYGLKDVGIHVYINSFGEIQWGRSLEKAPGFPDAARDEDLVILVYGRDNSLNIKALTTLRALLPVINAVHGNTLSFTGMIKHHARLGIGRDGKLIEPALQMPPH